ncbi:MAG TPA: hypothetical protein PK299_09055 [Anaerolineales bacterium]|nr:hypothetical protein [Anaerolineales bacterium]
MEPEKITIVEGPTPEFDFVTQPWLIGMAEGISLPYTAHCVVRTFNGQALVDRCLNAWRSGRDTILEYRKSDGLKESALILAARAGEVEEGQVLQLWVKLEPDPQFLTEQLAELGFDEDEDDLDDPETD